MITFILLLLLMLTIIFVVALVIAGAAGALSGLILIVADISIGIFLFSLIFKLFRKKK